MRKRTRRWIWFGATALVLALVVFNLRHNPEWRRFDWHRFWLSLLSARPGLLLLALLTVFASHLVRAYRWKYLMHPVKEGSLLTLFKAQILGFSSIYLIGRTGEFVRPAYVAKKEEVSVSSMMAVWLLERIFDQTALVVLFSLATFLLPAELMSRGSSVIAILQRAAYFLLAMVVVIVGILIVFRLKTEQCTRLILRLLRFLPARYGGRAGHLLKSFSDGLQVVRGLRAFSACVALTAAVWAVNATTFWFVMKSLSGPVGELPWVAAAVVMFCASLGLLVQFPGIGGGYQVATILALTDVFRIDAPGATGAAILIWLLVSVPVLALGLGLLIHEGLTLRKLEAMAEEERAAVVGAD